MTTMVDRAIRALFDDTNITVYQAFSPRIAEPAVASGTFVAPFDRGRMTWIKPSFLWMMYRSGWAQKPDQERVLAITMTRSGFEKALAASCLSHYDPAAHPSRDAWRRRLRRAPVRIQWDPERTPAGRALPWRSLQVGLSGPAVHGYVDSWITGIEDITALLPARREGTLPLPDERLYPLPEALADAIGATPPRPLT